MARHPQIARATTPLFHTILHVDGRASRLLGHRHGHQRQSRQNHESLSSVPSSGRVRIFQHSHVSPELESFRPQESARGLHDPQLGGYLSHTGLLRDEILHLDIYILLLFGQVLYWRGAAHSHDIHVRIVSDSDAEHRCGSEFCARTSRWRVGPANKRAQFDA